MFKRKTKIVCSIGPACNNDETLRAMIKGGMNVARFNFSHGTYEWHREVMLRVRRIANELDIPVAIMLDTKGPEIRTGLVADDKSIQISAGEAVEVVADDSLCFEAEKGKTCHISISWKEAPKKLAAGVRILIADGLVELKVTNIVAGVIRCKAINSGVIGSKKNVNLIGVHAGLPIMSDKDKEDLKFGSSMDVDIVALSFVSFATEVAQVREYLKGLGSNARIIAKIENEEGVNNIEAIAKEADGVMVARGDLGVQLPTERIPLVQKSIIHTCRRIGKCVITATQMLDSMITNPRPTRAELTDVSNAVFDGTDAVMLSGETASGKYPVDAVKTMALITKTTEQSDEYLMKMRQEDTIYKPGTNVGAVVAHSAYKLSRNIEAKAIIVPTMHGNTARIIGSFRPEQIVIAVTPDAKVARQLMTQWGVFPVLCGVADGSEDMKQNAIKLALDKGAIKLGDKVVMCAGIPLASPLMINTIQVTLVGNVIARGSVAGFGNAEIKKVSGRVIHDTALGVSAVDLAPLLKEKLKGHEHSILVCSRITDEMVGVLRAVDAVICEGGSDVDTGDFSLINRDLVWALNVRDAGKVLESDLSITLDGEQGIIYEGVI